LIAQAVKADVSDQTSIAHAVESAASAWGRLDVLVSNAAITDDTPFEAISVAR
jgi:NAD(P)-dependent dehydrogenase (short-subunit alcohol dehydrogenase family)